MVLETQRGTYFTLDEVGAYVWNLLDGTKDLDQVVDAVCEAYDVPPETARSDIRELLDELAGERLLEGWPLG